MKPRDVIVMVFLLVSLAFIFSGIINRGVDLLIDINPNLLSRVEIAEPELEGGYFSIRDKDGLYIGVVKPNEIKIILDKSANQTILTAVTNSNNDLHRQGLYCPVEDLTRVVIFSGSLEKVSKLKNKIDLANKST